MHVLTYIKKNDEVNRQQSYRNTAQVLSKKAASVKWGPAAGIKAWIGG